VLSLRAYQPKSDGEIPISSSEEHPEPPFGDGSLVHLARETHDDPHYAWKDLQESCGCCEAEALLVGLKREKGIELMGGPSLSHEHGDDVPPRRTPFAVLKWLLLAVVCTLLVLYVIRNRQEFYFILAIRLEYLLPILALSLLEETLSACRFYLVLAAVTRRVHFSWRQRISGCDAEEDGQC